MNRYTRPILWFFMCAGAYGAGPARRFSVNGMVVRLDATARTAIISHDEIPGYMDAMMMPFRVRDAGQFRSLHQGDSVSFTLVVDAKESWIENVRPVRFESAERDPSLATRLALLDSMTANETGGSLAAGAPVPDFSLTDQRGQTVTLSGLRGKVVALNFVYTRCPLPDYCFRLSNHFARLRKRFAGNPELILLTLTFDPVHDKPEVLARYAETWKADSRDWHFVTGPEEEVRRICSLFGVSSWRDDGFLTHSLHTAIIGRDGKLRTNIEGNKFSATQLGDLVGQVLKERPPAGKGQ